MINQNSDIFLEIGIWDGNWMVGKRKLDRVIFGI